MKWREWCHCWCCCARPPTDKTDGQTLDDSSSLIQESGVGAEHAFYVPRRHSSFHTSTYNTVSMQPGKCPHSDSCSSSEEDEIPEQRGRCWSTIPTATDVSSLVSNGLADSPPPKDHTPLPNCRSSGQDPETRSPLLFDKHTLTEIREAEDSSPASENTSNTPPNDEVYGHLSFVTAYDEQEQRLSVFLDRATDLPKKSSCPDEEQQQQYSTFVRLSLTTSKKSTLLSRTARNTRHPVYKEEHVFNTCRAKWRVGEQGGSCPSLKLSLFDCDRQGRHDAVGHVLLPLAKVDGQEKHRLPLTPMAAPVWPIGQLLVSLFYSSLQSRLSVHVIKARHLRMDPEAHRRPLNKGKAPPLETFVKVTLMCGGQKVKTTRSPVVPGGDTPLYNHKCDFVVPATFLGDSSLVATVVARGVLGRNTPMGRVTAGPYVETGQGVPTHWGRMVRETRSVVQWRNLYL